ncbi:hypothetical protein [Hespellia stercorisuis]|uniref:Putative ABC-transporter type IV n=1 Tax=Hespellia stercorisuis DSM 15480 TaxID=1121950 RepID=A0A1M6QC54_9FIRM|nr:hypothetical protein [Hespellia stercorisuis]SHK17657.1 Putative ABC-transporter type IV [Hespellia stercorisuis DSM 15480]
MLKKIRNGIFKYMILFVIFGGIYFGIETWWRGHLANWRMAVMGGIIAVLIGMTNSLFSRETSFILQCIVGMLIATLAEAIMGTYWLDHGMKVWTYSRLPFTYVHGTVNLLYSLGWFFLSALCIVVDDVIRWLFFGEPRPHYKLR